MTESDGPLAVATAIRADDCEGSAGSFPDRKMSGPKTPAGKRRAALNSLRHGIYADAVLIKGESRDDYLRFARAIVAGLDVQNALEMACAERLVSALWRSRRARRYEQAYLNKADDDAGQKRERLDRADQELAAHERDTEAARRLSNCERMTVPEIEHAASAVAEVFWGATRDTELPDEFWELFPERGNISCKRVARIAERVREIFKLAHVARDSHAFWGWVAEQRGFATYRLQCERDEAADEYGKALRQTFLLDPTYDEAFNREVHAGRVLHDAERRLDRQVTQALADLEAARKLRP